MSRKKNQVKHVLAAYEESFVIEKKDSSESHIDSLRAGSLAGYRVKTIKSGPILEVEAYPFWKVPHGPRKKRGEDSTQAQKNLNDKNTKKHVTRLINANFRNYEDIWLTYTYPKGKMPADFEQAKKDMTNLIRRMKNWLKKRERYKDFELKYIYVTEYTRDGNKVRAHHHMVTNFPDRDDAEKLWNCGGRTQSRRLQSDDFGFEGMARYITKEKGNKTMKRYTPSRNLKQPTVTVSDTKLTRRRAEKIAKDEISAHEIFQQWHKNYQFKDMQVNFSDFVSGAYLYVRMKRIDSPIKRKLNRGGDKDGEERPSH
ncbi:rolling circle replication-associated protein [Lysinibacillus fusiformis]|uniref:rolling circle replication-associated protein n=1 Tax=Lysinibacillus fusiformis TaxID=28031 RepID=UPI003AAD29DD